MTFIHVMLARIRGFLRPGDLDRDFDEELAAHLAMAEEAKMRQGMTRREARRLARVELGGLAQLREAGREARGLPWLDASWLDFKLGIRMLRKSWGLTLVGGLAMTVAIGIGAVVWSFYGLVFGARLPLDEGDRVVAIQTWDAKTQRRSEASWLDFERWRDRLQSVEDVGAFRHVERNLVTADGVAGPVPVAEMTAAGFRLARIAPLLGRPLVEEDELQEASPVAVIGYDVWNSRFSADPEVLGQTIRLGDTVHSVVGVMPEDFAFPVNYRFWIPLRGDRSQDLPPGPFGVVFGRLSAGATVEQAQAELTTLGLLAEAEDEEDLYPRIGPYTLALIGDFDRGDVRWMSRLILFCVALLLVPPCANIAILVYARTVTRQEEFAARYVLGASRGRIVGQIFIEVLVLAIAAAGIALGVARLALRLAQQDFLDRDKGGAAPFWMDFTLSAQTVLVVAGMAVVAALIAGVAPAMRATGRQMQSGLSALSSRTGLQLGTTWTALIVAQVAFSSAALPPTVEMAWGTIRKGVLGPGFAAEQYLTARISMDEEALAGVTASSATEDPFRFGVLQGELIEQLQAEPGISAVTIAAAVPGEESWTKVEIEEIVQPDQGILPANNLIRFNEVDDAFFDVFDIPILVGRDFDAGDFDSARAVVVVNQSFVQQFMGEDAQASKINPLGRRVRYLSRSAATGPAISEPQEWYEIVGVVADRPAHATAGTIYHPMAPGELHPASVAIRYRPTSDAEHLAEARLAQADIVSRLRQISTELDPTLRLEAILPLDEIYRENAVGNNIGASALAAVTLSILLLSGAGIYALTSFTVNQRRREIGIRSALGAQPQRLLFAVFRRALGQVGAGALIGILLALLLSTYLPIEALGGWEVPGVVPATAVLMILIALLAAAGPARRGLRVDPIEELREG